MSKSQGKQKQHTRNIKGKIVEVNKGVKKAKKAKKEKIDPFYSIFDDLSLNQKPSKILELDTDLDKLMGNDSMAEAITLDRRIHLAMTTNDYKVLTNIYNQSSEPLVKKLVLENMYIDIQLLAKIANDKNESNDLRSKASMLYQSRIFKSIFGTD